MLNVLNLKCPNCGANLEIAQDTTTFACGYCGATQIVERRGGTVALKLVTDAISKVQAGTDKTAAELTIRRLKEELAELDAPFRKLRANADKSNENNSTAAVVITVAGLLFIVCPIVINGFTTLAVIFLILIIICGSGYYYYETSVVEALFKERTAPIRAKYKEMTARIEELKKIADS